MTATARAAGGIGGTVQPSITGESRGRILTRRVPGAADPVSCRIPLFFIGLPSPCESERDGKLQVETPTDPAHATASEEANR